MQNRLTGTQLFPIPKLIKIMIVLIIQERHPYTGNLNSETPGDSKNAFAHCRYVLGLVKL